MLDSVRHRWLLAVGGVLFVGVALSLFFSWPRRDPEKPAVDGAAVWKRRNGVDLAALSRLPPNADSKSAQELDRLLAPAGLILGSLRAESRRPPRSDSEYEALSQVREYLRSAIRSGTADPRALSPQAVALIDRHAAILDAVAAHVANHPDIQWHEDRGPRPRSSSLFTSDHLTLHRLLIGRAFLALDRGEPATAQRMLATSQALGLALEKRQELDAHFIAVGAERLQLALLRRGGSALGVVPRQPMEGLRERYLAGMSGEAALILTNSRQGAFTNEDDVGETVVRLFAGPKFVRAANEAVASAAGGVDEIRRAEDGCLELTKKRPVPRGPFAGAFYLLDSREAWRRFMVLALDRAMTAAVLTGETLSPCPSVTIAVRDEGATRTVETKGLPPESENVVSLPAKVTVPLQKGS
jgi:hypothetical protein